MPDDVKVQLYEKHDGQSTIAANRDYIVKAMSGDLDQGWSRLVLQAMVDNRQSHLYDLLKPTAEDKERYVEHKKKQAESEERRRNKNKSVTEDAKSNQKSSVKVTNTAPKNLLRESESRSKEPSASVSSANDLENSTKNLHTKTDDKEKYIENLNMQKQKETKQRRKENNDIMRMSEEANESRFQNFEITRGDMINRFVKNQERASGNFGGENTKKSENEAEGFATD